MEVVKVYPPHLYSIRYEGDKMNIYKLISANLTDIDYLENFFAEFKENISDFLIESTGFPREEVEEYIALVNDKMIDINEEIEQLCRNIISGKVENFGNLFQPHSPLDIRNMPEGGGISKKYTEPYLPVKCYGSGEHPSLVRIYAIELSLDCYIIIYGGIKIVKDTNVSPTFDDKGRKTFLEREIKKRVCAVCEFLAEKGIYDKEGLLQYMEEDHED